MTDSTAHNKGMAAALATKLDRDDIAGQIFCNSHTTLQFVCGMSQIITGIEDKTGTNNPFNGFLLDLDIDSLDQTTSKNHGVTTNNSPVSNNPLSMEFLRITLMGPSILQARCSKKCLRMCIFG